MKKIIKNCVFLNDDISKSLKWNFKILVLIEAEFTAESENYNQSIPLFKACLLDWLKEEYPKSSKSQKFPIFKRKNLEKSKVKLLFFFMIEAEFTTEAEHYSHNMPKF